MKKTVNNHQSNAHAGAAFEKIALSELKKSVSESLEGKYSVDVGVAELKKPREFDIGCDSPPIVVECKCHKWTESGNMPSAKITSWNEAMYYFTLVPKEYRKIFFVLRDCSEKCTLAEYYIEHNRHLIPPGVEIWEYDEKAEKARIVYTAPAAGAHRVPPKEQP